MSDKEHGVMSIGIQNTNLKHAGSPQSTEPSVPSPIEKATTQMQERMHELSASSCTLYVRDKLTRELRLVAMPGVRHQEPMHGVVLHAGAENRIASGKWKKFEPDARAERAESLNQLSPRSRIWVEEGYDLYGGFGHREDVNCYARFLQRDTKDVDVALFVNFSNSNALNTRQRKTRKGCLELFDYLCDLRDDIAEGFDHRAALAMRQLLRLTQPAESLLLSPVQEGQNRRAVQSHCQKYFETLLDSLLITLAQQGLGPVRKNPLSMESAFAEILLHDADSDVLRVVAHRGMKAGANQERIRFLDDPRGVTTWVAERRQGIVIPNLDADSSAFGKMYVPVVEGIKGELAVPLTIGDQFVGVLNVETRQLDAFDLDADVDIASFAADRAAIALHVSNQGLRAFDTAARTRKLFRVSHDTATHEQSATRAMDEIAKLMAEWLAFTHCALWTFDQQQRTFANAGRNDHSKSGPTEPREDGWSDFIMRTGNPVFLSREATNDTEFQRRYWNSATKSWQEVPPDAVADAHIPVDEHEFCFTANMLSELGVPIKQGKKRIGVAWLKEDATSRIRVCDAIREPSPERMEDVLSLASLVAVLLDSIQHGEHQRRQAVVAKEYRSIQKRLFSTREIDVPGLTGYVICEPYGGSIGGDFYAVEVLDKDRQTVGVLLGDAEGHGPNAALKCLPLISAFKTCSRDSVAPAHVLDRLHGVAVDMEIFATALYFVCGSFEGHRYLNVTSAGHWPLLRFPKTGYNPIPNEQGPAKGMQLGIESPPFLASNPVQVCEGDLLVVCTDGIFEANGMGTNGVAAEVFKRRDKDTKEIAESIYHAALERTSGQVDDDVTVMVLKVLKIEPRPA